MSLHPDLASSFLFFFFVLEANTYPATCLLWCVRQRETVGGGEMCYCGEEKEERHGRTREDGRRGGVVETSEAIISGRAVVAV